MGLGDDIMLTAKARSIYEKTGKKMVPVETISNQRKVKWSKMFDNNPHMTQNLDEGTPYEIRPRPYSDGFRRDGVGTFHKMKILWPKKGELYFTEEEIQIAKKLVDLEKYVTIEPSTQTDTYSSNRQWGIHKWQEIIYRNPYVNWVQVMGINAKQYDNHPHDSAPLKNCKIVEADARTYFAIIGMAKFHLSNEGGSVHAATSQNVKSLVIFGGLSAPWAVGYKDNINVYCEHPESPCGRQYKCDHCSKCMEAITVDYIDDHVKKLILEKY